MSLSAKAIERLFDRLLTTYGKDFQSYYAAVDPGAVKALWGHELSGFNNNLDAISWALENLPERCPNVITFKNLCRQAPQAVVPMLPSPKVDPVIAAMVVQGARKIIAENHHATGRGAWAQSILRQHAAGRKYTPTVLKMAQDGLRNLGLSFAPQ